MVLKVRLPQQGRSRQGLANLAASVLLLLGPFLTFLRYHGYPLFAPEAILVSLLMVVAGVPLFVMLQRGGLWKIVSLGFVMYVFVDLQFDLEKYVSFWLVPVPLAAIAWFLREHLASALAAAGTVFYVSAFALPIGERPVTLWAPAHAVSVDESLPPVIHVILDELAGSDPSRTAVNEPHSGVDALESVLVRHGFLLFRNVYSRHVQTQTSLAQILNDTATGNPMAFLRGRSAPDMDYWPPFVLQESVHFRSLAAQGYVLDVYQSDFMDFCRTNEAPVERCLTYRRNSARAIAAMTLPTRAKTIVLVLYYLHHASHTFTMARDVYRSAPAEGAPPSRLRGLVWNGDVGMSLLQLLRYVEADAQSGIRGRVFLIHAMDPHYPYTRDADCRTVPEMAEWLDAADPSAAPNSNTEAGRAHRYRRYRMQLACLAKELDQFLTWVSALPSARDAVILIHSDHGSRIGLRPPMVQFSDAFSATDVADYCSTLFAAKAPALSAGVVEKVAILGELLTAARRSGFATVEPRDVDTISVFLGDRPTNLGTLLLKRQSVGGGRFHLVPASRQSGR